MKTKILFLIVVLALMLMAAACDKNGTPPLTPNPSVRVHNQ